MNTGVNGMATGQWKTLKLTAKFFRNVIAVAVVGTVLAVSTNTHEGVFVSVVHAQLIPGLTNRKVSKSSYHNLMAMQSQLAAIANNKRHTKATRRAANYDLRRVTKELAKRRRATKKKPKG